MTVAGLCDPDVLDGLAATLGDDARALLLNAFGTELSTRPAIIAEQAARGDAAAARASAHALKGAALVVGAKSVIAAAERIEFADAAQLVDLAAELTVLSGRR